MIAKVLSTAVTFWLKSQVERVEELKIEISGNNRQILQGYIPKVFLRSSYAVYQGLHLGQVELQGVNFKTNLAEIVKGKPFRLLEPIPVTGKILLSAKDLNASLKSVLLLNGLGDVLTKLLAVEGIDPDSVSSEDDRVSWEKITLFEQKLTITGTLSDRSGRVNQLIISTGIQMSDRRTLLLSPLKIQGLPEAKNPSSSLEIDLGEEVAIEQLELTEQYLTCIGSLKIMP